MFLFVAHVDGGRGSESDPEIVCVCVFWLCVIPLSFLFLKSAKRTWPFALPRNNMSLQTGIDSIELVLR